MKTSKVKGKWLAVLILISAVALPCLASPRDNVNDALRKAQRDTDAVVKNVQTFLQMTGRWSPAPSGQDMQVCQSLQAFQAQVGQVLRSNNSSQTYSGVQMQLQQLGMQAQALDQQFMQAGMTAGIAGSWSKVKNDLAQATQAFYFGGAASEWNSWYNGVAPVAPGLPAVVPGQSFVPGVPYVPGAIPSAPFAPGMPVYGAPTFDAGQAANTARRAEQSFERVVQQVSSFLGGRGKWPPAAGSAEMQLCQQLQQFQAQLRKLASDASGRVSYAAMQADVQQLAMAQSAIDAQLAAVGATPDLYALWNSTKTELSGFYQGFYSGGGQYFWAR